MGLGPDDAERVIVAVARAGVSWEASMAAMRWALSRPPSEHARMAAQLRVFAASLPERAG
jgi:hypothetical protein